MCDKGNDSVLLHLQESRTTYRCMLGEPVESSSGAAEVLSLSSWSRAWVLISGGCSSPKGGSPGVSWVLSWRAQRIHLKWHPITWTLYLEASLLHIPFLHPVSAGSLLALCYSEDDVWPHSDLPSNSSVWSLGSHPALADTNPVELNGAQCCVCLLSGKSHGCREGNQELSKTASGLLKLQIQITGTPGVQQGCFLTNSL